MASVKKCNCVERTTSKSVSATDHCYISLHVVNASKFHLEAIIVNDFLCCMTTTIPVFVPLAFDEPSKSSPYKRQTRPYYIFEYGQILITFVIIKWTRQDLRIVASIFPKGFRNSGRDLTEKRLCWLVPATARDFKWKRISLENLLEISSNIMKWMLCQ